MFKIATVRTAGTSLIFRISKSGSQSAALKLRKSCQEAPQEATRDVRHSLSGELEAKYDEGNFSTYGFARVSRTIVSFSFPDWVTGEGARQNVLGDVQACRKSFGSDGNLAFASWGWFFPSSKFVITLRK